MRLFVLRDRLWFHRRKIVALSCVLAAWLASAVPASAAFITVVPSTSEVTVGESFDVSFIVDGLIGDLSLFKFSIEFDNLALAYNNDVALGSAVDDPFYVQGFYDQANNPTLIQDNLGISGTLLSNGTLLLTASFTALSAGETFISALFRFTQGDFLINGANQDEIFGEDALDGDEVRFQNSVNVVAPTSVPEPGTLFLLSTGLAASVVASRRRQRRGLRD